MHGNVREMGVQTRVIGYCIHSIWELFLNKKFNFGNFLKYFEEFFVDKVADTRLQKALWQVSVFADIVFLKT